MLMIIGYYYFKILFETTVFFRDLNSSKSKSKSCRPFQVVRTSHLNCQNKYFLVLSEQV